MRTAGGYDFGGKRVFVSGPMTGLRAWNKPAFDEVAEWVRNQGAGHVFNPADLSPREGEEPWPHEACMLRTLHELTGIGVVPAGIRPLYDAIALLPGWERSEGARAEKLVAGAIGLDVVELGDAL